MIEAVEGEIANLPLKDKIDHMLLHSGLRKHCARESKDSLDSRVENLDEAAGLVLHIEGAGSISIFSRRARGHED